MLDVPAYVDEAGIVTTVWMPNYDERLAIMAGKPIIMHTLSSGQMFPTAIKVSGVIYVEQTNGEEKEED